MIGSVENNHAILPVTFATETLGDIVAKFVVDTGYTAMLTLPPHQIAALGLALIDDMEVFLADGTSGTADVYFGVIIWHGELREIFVIEMDSDPLLGAGLLRGSRLVIDFEESGAVTVTPL